jgi:GNAT superfamily N-acetyltransferase
MIRLATEADIDAIAALWCEGWHDGHADICPPELTALRTLDSFQQRTKAHLATTYVAEDVAGFFMIEGTEVYQMYVGRAGRGTGLATQLMARAEQIIFEAGHQIAWLACSIGNDRAARFYEKSGWTRQGTRVEQLEVTGGTFDLEVWVYEKSGL